MNIEQELANYTYPFDKPFEGKMLSLQENVETMWHMAESSIRGLLALVEGKNFDPQFRDVAIFLAKCWLKDYAELDRRIDEETTESADY